VPQFDAGLVFLLAVNLVLWTGLFLYVLRLHRQVRGAERDRAAKGERR